MLQPTALLRALPPPSPCLCAASSPSSFSPNGDGMHTRAVAPLPDHFETDFRCCCSIPSSLSVHYLCVVSQYLPAAPPPSRRNRFSYLCLYYTFLFAQFGYFKTPRPPNLFYPQLTALYTFLQSSHFSPPSVCFSILIAPPSSTIFTAIPYSLFLIHTSSSSSSINISR